jgi:type IV pilus assembly protein PilQ
MKGNTIMLYRAKLRKRKLLNLGLVWGLVLACLATLGIGQVQTPADVPMVLAQAGPTPDKPAADKPAEPAKPEAVKPATAKPEAAKPEAMKPEAAKPAEPATNGAEAVAERSIGGQAIQTLSFKKDMTIIDALRFLALKYQKNIVPTPRVNGVVTVTNLYDVSFEEAMTALIGPNHRFETQGNFIMVYTTEEFDQLKADKRRREYKHFTLYYLTAEEGEKMVKAFLSGDGMMARSSPAKSGVPGGQSISDEASGDNLAYQDTLVICDYPENITQIDEMLKKLDTRPLQVLIEATILAANLTEGMELGVDLNFAGGIALEGSAASGAIQDTVNGGVLEYADSATTPVGQLARGGIRGIPMETSGFSKTAGNGLRVGVTTGDFAMFITALEQITDVTIMANPKILAVNKQLGQVYIGTKLGYREGDVETAGGGTQQGAVKFLDTGTKLAFRPYIGNDGFIRMDIHPKDSSGNLNAQGVPNETAAELSTNVIVKDGQTVVIGGLFRDVVNSTKKQVPLFGNIPILGDFFKSTNDSTTRQEVIVLLTPHIIQNLDQLNSESRIQDVKRRWAGARDRLHWLNVGRAADDSYAKAAGLFSGGDTQGSLNELNWTLQLRPTYLEAIRLRERIVQETSGGNDQVIERIMLDTIEKQDSEGWLRN